MSSAETSARLTGLFGEAIVTTLSAVTGKDFRVVTAPAAGAATEGEVLAWQQEIKSQPGALSVGCDLLVSQAVGRMMLESAGIEESNPEELRSAWHEVAGQALGHLTNDLTSELGRELTLGAGREAAQDEVIHNKGLEWTEVGIQGPDGVWRMVVSWPRWLAELLASAPLPAPSSLAAGSSTFDLLLDIALPVAVSFGRTALQIREVLKLSTGSIIELNRLINEPVDVVVNDSIIARGEVVVVDGNYGVRITQIASREDRIRNGSAGSESVPAGVAA